jgi:G8 domain
VILHHTQVIFNKIKFSECCSQIRLPSLTSMMNFGPSSLLLLSLSLPAYSAFLRNSTSNNDIFDLSETRNLQVDGMKDFKPLTCNSALATAQCVPWTTKFGTSTVYPARIAIPCGECVTMNLAGGNVYWQSGIDIIGKLVFPNGYKVTVTTPVIAIQGELEMTASKTVDGIPNIKFTMVGVNDKFFAPIDVNARACNGAATCNVGKKSIVVAGGKVTIRGLPANTPSWTRLSAVDGPSNNPVTIVVPNTIIGKWGVGAEILITPHTRVWNENQVRTIKSITPSGNFALLELNAPILRPTTVRESPDFAVEVALLSRNIVFQGGADTNAQHGGHFMVMHTPTVVQTIEGVDFQKFGQQGNLGRYPIHFHFCNDVPGSVVSKNTIRQSNQRCVVVHGTNQLLIQENVAFDTKGHCYITEDGMEVRNQFIRNLGAQTGIPDTIIPNQGTNGDETDKEPATFWITSPTNSWIGNVAAGSEHSGYWFEPKLRGARASAFPGLVPQLMPLVMFRDNVAHSNTAGNLVSAHHSAYSSPRNQNDLSVLSHFNRKGSYSNVYPRLFSTADDALHRLESLPQQCIGIFSASLPQY